MYDSMTEAKGTTAKEELFGPYVDFELSAFLP
jgi:hypothetical protein